MPLLKQHLRKFLENLRLIDEEGVAEWNQWYAEQLRKLEAGEEIEPPWIAFPASLAWVGWNQGRPEAWKLNVWLPFWQKLSKEEKDAYLQRWQPPSEDWRESLTIYWVGHLSKLKEKKAEKSNLIENEGN